MDATRFWTWDPKVLRAAMKAKGVSVADLSVLTGLSQWRLYKYAALRGGRVPAPAVAKTIADALKVGATHPLRQTTGEAA